MLATFRDPQTAPIAPTSRLLSSPGKHDAFSDRSKIRTGTHDTDDLPRSISRPSPVRPFLTSVLNGRLNRTFCSAFYQEVCDFGRRSATTNERRPDVWPGNRSLNRCRLRDWGEKQSASVFFGDDCRFYRSPVDVAAGRHGPARPDRPGDHGIARQMTTANASVCDCMRE